VTLAVVYTISGLMAGIAGAVLAGRLNTANTASFRGGKGTIWSMLFGALLISTIHNGLNLFSAGNGIQCLVIGPVIILAVTIDATCSKLEARARKSAAI